MKWPWRRKRDREAFARFMREWALALEAQKPTPNGDTDAGEAGRPLEAFAAAAGGVAYPTAQRPSLGPSTRSNGHCTKWPDSHLRAHGLLKG